MKTHTDICLKKQEENNSFVSLPTYFLSIYFFVDLREYLTPHLLHLFYNVCAKCSAYDRLANSAFPVLFGAFVFDRNLFYPYLIIARQQTVPDSGIWDVRSAPFQHPHSRNIVLSGILPTSIFHFLLQSLIILITSLFNV